MMNASFEVFKLKTQLEILTKAPTLANANILLSQIKEIKDGNFQLVQDSFLTTLLIVMDNADGLKKNEIKTTLIQCINSILKSSQLNQELPYRTVITIILKQIFDFPTNTYNIQLSEELKMSAFDCFEVSSRQLSCDVVEAFMVEEKKILLSQCIFVCKEAILKEKYSKIRKSAVKALMSLFQVHDKADVNDIVLRDQISKIVFLVLPQISSVLVKVCEEETLKGSSLVEAAIQTLGRYLCLVFEDYEKSSTSVITNDDFKKLVQKSNESEEESNLLQPKNQTQADFIKNLKKSNEWLRAASKRLVPSITRLKTLQGSDHTKIRYELAVFSGNLLDRCLVNVRPLLPFLLENLILFADDPDSKVRELSQKYLKELSKKIPELNQEITELFSTHLMSMPRIILTGDDSEQIAGFTLLNSFIITISEQESQLNSLFDNSVMVERFLHVMISSCKIAVPDGLLFYENLGLDLLNDQYYQMKTPWKHFRNLKNELVVKKFSEICKNLGKSKSAQVCVDFLLSEMNSLEYLVLIIEMLQCGQAASLEQDQVEGIVEEFLSETYWTMKTFATERIEKQRQSEHEEWFKDCTLGLYESAIEVRLCDVPLDDQTSGQTKMVTLKTIKYNIICTCLVVELMGVAAKILGQNFQRFLLRTLHRVLEKAGNSNFIIRSAGLHSLESISNAMGFSDVSHLIDGNADFLLFNIQKLLKRNHDNDSVFDMLSVVFKYSKTSMTLYIEDIVETASEKIASHKHNTNANSYLKLFSLYVESVKKWDASCVDTDNTDDKVDDENWGEFFKQCLFELENTSLEDNEPCPLDGTTDDNEEPMKEEQIGGEQVEEIPSHIKLVQKVLTSTLQFFASSNSSEVILAHKIFMDSLPILHRYENDYLSMIHQMWYPFLKQFQVQNYVVLQHSFRLLSLIARPAQDVILKRSTDDVIPKLNEFLHQTLKSSSAKVNLSYTQEYKLQHEILSGYGALAVDLDLEDRLFDGIVEVLLKYEKISNEKLLSASTQSLVAVKNHNPGLFFYKTNC